MTEGSLGKLQMERHSRGGGAFACAGAAVCMAIAGSAAPALFGPQAAASDRALVIGTFAVGLGLAYVGLVLLSLRLQLFERGVVKRSLRGEQIVRYADLESFRYQSANAPGTTSVTHIYRSRAIDSRDLVATFRAGPEGLGELAPLTAAAVDPLTARLASELERTGSVHLDCGLTLTRDAIEYGGERIPLVRLTVQFERFSGTLRFRNGGRELFRVQRDAANILPLMALIERRVVLAA